MTSVLFVLNESSISLGGLTTEAAKDDEVRS